MVDAEANADDDGLKRQDAADGVALLPVRMLNEYAYCPRLFHLMHVDGRWEDNKYTIEGRHVHRRVDKLDHVLPDAARGGANADEDAQVSSAASGNATGDVAAGTHAGDDADANTGASNDASESQRGDEPPVIARSVPLSSEALGLSAKLDLVSIDDHPPPGEQAEAVPVETKRGRVPNNPERSWEPERVQLMAQGLLLRLANRDPDSSAPARPLMTRGVTATLEFSAKV